MRHKHIADQSGASNLGEETVILKMFAGQSAVADVENQPQRQRARHTGFIGPWNIPTCVVRNADPQGKGTKSLRVRVGAVLGKGYYFLITSDRSFWVMDQIFCQQGTCRFRHQPDVQRINQLKKSLCIQDEMEGWYKAELYLPS